MLTDDFDAERYAQLCLDQGVTPWSYTAQDYPYDGAAQGANGKLSVHTAVGVVRNAIDALGSGQAMTMPDGISCRRNDPGKGYETKLTRGGFGRKTHGTSRQAAQEMLDQSARNEHSQALGGSIHYHDAASAVSAMNSGKLDHANPPYHAEIHSPAEADARFIEHQHYVHTDRSRQQLNHARMMSQDGEPAELDPRQYAIALSQSRT